jgi:hypothetical protein
MRETKKTVQATKRVRPTKLAKQAKPAKLAKPLTTKAYTSSATKSHTEKPSTFVKATQNVEKAWDIKGARDQNIKMETVRIEDVAVYEDLYIEKRDDKRKRYAVGKGLKKIRKQF